MSTSSKIHWFPNTIRSVAMADVVWCGGKILLYVLPPEKALTIENLYIHFKATFDSGVDVADRLVESVSIVNKVPASVSSNADVSYIRTLDLNLSANVSREVEFSLDLTSLLNKGNVGYREYFTDTENCTYVMIQPAESLDGVENIGIIDLWKIDSQYTTEGIR